MTSTPEATDTTRTKTVSWTDPKATAALVGRDVPGLEFLTRWMQGEQPNPPIGELIGFHLTSVEEGAVEFTCVPDEAVYNPIGMVHGGLACTLLDSAAGCAVHSTLPAEFGYSSIEIKVNFMRPIHADTGPIVARGWVTKPGKRVCFADAELRDANGKILATASSSCLITPI